MLPSAGLRASASRLDIFEAQYPAHLFPCLRFTARLAAHSAKLGAEWIATPFSREIFILCFLPVYPGAFQTSVFEVCGSSSDSRSRIQRQTGNCQAAAAHLLCCAHAAMLVHAGPLPRNGNLRRSSRRAVTNKTSPAMSCYGVSLRKAA